LSVSNSDTIVAIATPPGRGGIGVIRISGTGTAAIAKAMLGAMPRPRLAVYGPFQDADAQPLDHGLALFFPAPHSFTGEDVLELQGHGGPVVLDMLLRRALSLGARVARPGEFSQRAFLNGKLDLTQAEAVADLIDSHTEQAARCAMNSLRGAFSSEIHQLLDALIQTRGYVEAALDFPDEDVDFLNQDAITRRLVTLRAHLNQIYGHARQGSLLREGMTLVIAGRPNVGKSSLLNRLAAADVAIVTELAGTTRDVLRHDIQVDGMPLRVIDTAGLHESGDAVEREGIRRAWAEIETADLILLVADASCGLTDEEQTILRRLPSGIPVLTVWNKIDLLGRPAAKDHDAIYLSALTGAGMELLRQALKDQVGYRSGTEGVYLARRRHLDALEGADQALVRAQALTQAGSAGELLAEELRAAQQALAEITGAFTPDDLLAHIFSSFCIGK
jgi:tRNA modification GTPase